VKDNIMRQALRAKFVQHEDLRQQLLATGNVRLVEHTTNDRYWGDGGDGSGRNMLGILLMELRAKLRAEQCRSRTTRASMRESPASELPAGPSGEEAPR
jgi:hypothetical protein